VLKEVEDSGRVPDFMDLRFGGPLIMNTFHNSLDNRMPTHRDAVDVGERLAYDRPVEVDGGPLKFIVEQMRQIVSDVDYSGLMEWNEGRLEEAFERRPSSSIAIF
jgi:hypothetical protein